MGVKLTGGSGLELTQLFVMLGRQIAGVSNCRADVRIPHQILRPTVRSTRTVADSRVPRRKPPEDPLSVASEKLRGLEGGTLSAVDRCNLMDSFCDNNNLEQQSGNGTHR